MYGAMNIKLILKCCPETQFLLVLWKKNLNYTIVGKWNLAIWTTWTESYSLCYRKTPLGFKRMSQRRLNSVGLYRQTVPSAVSRVLAGPSCIGNKVEFWRWRRRMESKTHESLFSYHGKIKFAIFTNKKPEILKWTKDGNVMSFHLLVCIATGRNKGIKERKKERKKKEIWIKLNFSTLCM